MIRNQFKNIRSHPKFSQKLEHEQMIINGFAYHDLCVASARWMTSFQLKSCLEPDVWMKQVKKKNQIEFVRWHTSYLDDDDDKEINTIPYYYHNAAIVIWIQCMCTTIREWLQCVAGKMVLGRKIFELQIIKYKNTKARKIVNLTVATQINLFNLLS